MKLLIDSTDKVVIDIVETAEVTANGNINVGTCIYAVPNITVLEVDTVPDNVKPQAYKYIDGEFVVNEDYREPFDLEATVRQQQEIIDQLLIDSLGV